MPIRYMTSLARDLVYARWWGRIDFDQFEANFRTYLADPLYRPGRPELIDLSGVEDIDADFGLVRAALRQVNAQAAPVPVDTLTAIWAPDDLPYGLARMYQALAENAEGVRVTVHRHEAGALGALGQPEIAVAALLAAGDFAAPDGPDAVPPGALRAARGARAGGP